MITIYDDQVSQVTTAKSLGVTIDNKLDWSSHIDELTKKVASDIGAIKRIRHLEQKPQDRAGRVLTYSNYDADAGHLFELLRWKNLASQQQIQRAIMVFKSLQGLAPDYLCSKFERRETA
ncbi:hypothetical protein pdam_00023276 [Pocillopora damicornis]|uniref:Uncharacterized protein n=1 Tax=Pocillopora damicornis TaxID=46731 RepID=A0A3M6TZ03_POCDA|nr:hypothetical protein pdam_00023276 [Pocillopora damicornis]